MIARLYRYTLALLIVSCGLSAALAEPVRLIEPIDFGPILTKDDVKRLPPRPLNLRPGTQQLPGIRTLFSLPNDPFFVKQWYFHNVGQPDEKGQIGIPGADIKLYPALSVFAAQREVTLAIVDSGLDLKHEDVSADVLWTNEGE